MDSATAAPSINPRRALIQLFSRLRTSKGQKNPLPIYTQLTAMGEVIPAPWGGNLVTSYRLCHSILRDKTWTVPDRAWRSRQSNNTRWRSPASLQMSQTLPLLNPPHHTQIRRTLGNPFDQSTLFALHRTVEKAVDHLLDDFTERLRDGAADFVTLVSEELPVITIGQWMNLPPADYALLRTLTHDQVHTQELFPTASDLALSDAATAQLRAYFSEFIKERRKRPGNDPVSQWIHTWDAHEADRDAADAAVHSLALFMILAALETTSHLLANTVRLLLEHPSQMDAIRSQPDVIPDAIEEVLRYDAPIHLISRVAAADTHLGEIPVPAGEMVHLLIGAAHHDPAQYTHPHVLDVGRRRGPRESGTAPTTGPSAHLGFGAGIHYCLGNALARLEAATLLTGLLKRPLRLNITAPAQWAPRIAFRRMTSLHLAAP
ncbi:cytochrome P450 [Streptomyces sp. NPDC006476]|uniref:cytochrome P450 n=1 Tax=Streptomyces sp. NPDC006476 TaxID=3157175 RepID=UPI0033B58619